MSIDLPDAGADGVDTIPAQHAGSGEQAAVLPVREPELGTVQGVLPVHPAGEAVPDERGVHLLVKAPVRLRVFADQARYELWAMLVEKLRSLPRITHELERHLGCFLPLPLPSHVGDG